MKKFGFKKLLSLVIVAALVLGVVGVTAWAATTAADVTFDVASKTFSFKSSDLLTALGLTDTYDDDLFDMENMMPGDTAARNITVKVDNVGANSVELILHVENHNQFYTALMTDTVSVNGAEEPIGTLTVKDEGGNVLSDAELIGPDGVSLGVFSSADADKTLSVEFQFNINAGNDYAGKIASVVWYFEARVTEPTVGPSIPDDPVPLAKPELDKTNHYGYIVGRGFGGVQPGEYITRAEVATIFFRMLTDASRAECWSQVNEYTDVPAEEWYNNAVSTLTNCGILEGYEDGSFRPDAPITRAEFATMATRFYDEPGVYSADAFTDIADSWARDFINRAAELGLVDGYGDGTFRPQQNITRAEAMQLTNKILERGPVKEHLLPDMITWVDNVDTEIWYFATVQEATNSHLYDWEEYTEMAGSYEIWTKLLPVRDWEALETQWSDAYSGQVPGAPSVEDTQS